MSKRPGKLTLLRDVSSYLLGAVLILKQAGIGFVPPHQVSLPLLAVGGLLVGVPGLAQVIQWWFTARIGTPGSPLAPASSGSGSSSPSPSSESEAA